MSSEEYILENLSCACCSDKIEEKLSHLPEVDTVKINFLNKTLRITTKEGIFALDKITKIAKSVEPDIIVRHRTGKRIASKTKFEPLIATSLLGLIIIVLNLVNITAKEMQIWLYLAAYLLIGWKVLYRALIKLGRGQLFDEHFLMTIATVGALFLGEYTEAAAVMLLYEIGLYFESKAVNNSRDGIKKLLHLKPDIVHKRLYNKVMDVALSAIDLGDEIVVLPGERIPLDGVVIEGETSLDTSALTGESIPTGISVNDYVMSGTLNLTGRIVMKTTSTDSDSTVSRIMNLVDSAAMRKSPSEKFITRFSQIYTPAVVFIALCIALIPPVIIGQPHSVWLKRAMIFLIVSCPCALVISIPLTNYAAIGAAARRGILFKGSNFIDLLSKVKTFVYDKTGTLTTGRLAVSEVQPVPGVSETELISAALTCEVNSSHPLSTALQQKYISTVPYDHTLLHQETHGMGIKAQTVEHTLYAGSSKYLAFMGVKNIPSEPEETCIFVSRNNLCLGYITFRDELRPAFAEIIRKLRGSGIRNHLMLTGDHAFQAEKVAKELNLKEFRARLMPDDKLTELKKIEQKFGTPVAFIGDGLNDAPVISIANIGIAMGKIGNQLSIETADVVLMHDEPEQILTMIRLSRKTRSILWQNILFSLTVKIMIMVLGTLGLATLWEAVIADVGVTLLAILNATRLLRNME